MTIIDSIRNHKTLLLIIILFSIAIILGTMVFDHLNYHMCLGVEPDTTVCTRLWWFS